MTMIETIGSGLAVATITGLFYLAYNDQPSFWRVYNTLTVCMGISLLGGAGFQIGEGYATGRLLPLIDEKNHEQASLLVAADHALTAWVPYAGLAIWLLIIAGIVALTIGKKQPK